MLTNIVKDGVVESKALTHATHTIDVFTDGAEGLPTQQNDVNSDALITSGIMSTSSPMPAIRR